MIDSAGWALFLLLGACGTDGPIDPGPGGALYTVTFGDRIPVAGVALIAAGDLDGDGDSDLAVAHTVEDGPSSVSILLRGADGRLSPGASIEVGPDPISSLQVADADGNGDLEIVAVDDIVAIDVSPSGDLSMLPWALTPLPSGWRETASAKPVVRDFDGDGSPDAATIVENAGATERMLAVRYGSGAPIWMQPVTGRWLDLDGSGSRLVVSDTEGGRYRVETWVAGPSGFGLGIRSETALPAPATTPPAFTPTGEDTAAAAIGIGDTLGFVYLDLSTGLAQFPDPIALTHNAFYVYFALATQYARIAIVFGQAGEGTLFAPDEDGFYEEDDEFTMPERIGPIRDVAAPSSRPNDPSIDMTVADEDEVAEVEIAFARDATEVRVRMTGLGTIVSSPAGIECTLATEGGLESGTCDATLPIAFAATLEARPAPGWRFVRWIQPVNLAFATPRTDPLQAVSTSVARQFWFARFERIAMGPDFVVASDDGTFAKTCGAVHGWGDNRRGAFGVGIGALGEQPSPVDLGWLADASAFDARREVACAVRSQGRVWCSGSNGIGQLGSGSTEPQATEPVEVAIPMASVRTFAGVSCGEGYCCAWELGGKAWCWGTNMFNQLGTGTINVDPQPPSEVAIGNVRQIDADSGATSCAVTVTGEVWCWGRTSPVTMGGTMDNEFQVPSPTPVDSRAMERVPFRGAAEVAVGNEHACVRTDAGAVWCWGGGDAGGILGDGEAFSDGSALVLAIPAGAVDIDAALQHTCAAMDDGRVLCWGLNNDGRAIPDATIPNQVHVPTAVPGVTGAVQVATGNVHTCARRSDGAVLCWGGNGNGALGIGTTGEDYVVPTPALGACDER